MNKSELVNFIAENAELTKKDAGKALDAVLEGIKYGLSEDGKVSLIGFGNFAAQDVSEREFRNPKTGESVVKEAHRKPKFKPGKELHESVNK